MKKPIVFVIVAVLVSLSLSPAVYAEGTKAIVTDAYIPFEVWTGAGDSSATLAFDSEIGPMLNANEFVCLETAGAELDKSYYSVASDADGKAVVTLKEDYLKTLQNAKAYYFHAEFEKAKIGLRLFVVNEKVSCELVFTTDPEEPWDGKSSLSVDITGNDDISFGLEIFDKLMWDGREVDPSNYTVGSFGSVVSINLKAEYARTLAPGKYDLTAVFENADVALVFDTSYKYMPGDINGDAAVDVDDARLALRAAAKLDTLIGDALEAADVFGTGVITALEARKLLRVAAKLDDASFEMPSAIIDTVKPTLPWVTAPTTMEPTIAGEPTDPTVYEDLTVDCETAREIFGHPIRECEREDFVKYEALKVYPDGAENPEKYYCPVLYYVFTDGSIDLRDQDRTEGNVIIPASGAREYKGRTFYVHLPEFNGDRISVWYFPSGNNGICYQAFFDSRKDVNEIMELIISVEI